MTRARMTEQDIARLGREALDQSIEHLDAHALSRLNHARQQALAETQRPAFWRPAYRSGWLPLTAAGFTALALVIGLPMTTSVEQPAEDLMLSLLADNANMAALEDAELLEDLEMMLWLVDVENHAS
ncbi:MAG: DUF3619 family protein [Gammaproteobacteria bacterium]|nr:DUF3619 family protein [Gammaproteobacteria bacterium]